MDELNNVNEVVEATEEVAKTNSGKGFKVAALVGAVAAVGGLTYKFVIKPIVAKHKAKKEEKKANAMDLAIFDEKTGEPIEKDSNE